MSALIAVSTGMMLWDYAQGFDGSVRVVLRINSAIMLVWGLCAALLGLIEFFA